jgi:cell division protease FtsH
VDRPDKPARAAILALHLKHIKVAADVQPDRVAELTPGMTGADLANVVNEAALLATRRGAAQVGLSDTAEAVERSMPTRYGMAGELGPVTFDPGRRVAPSAPLS